MANITIYFRKTLFLLLLILLIPQARSSECLPEEIQIVYQICKENKLVFIEEEWPEDYWKTPYETERDGGGDCEDLSLWLLHKLTNMGYDCWLVMGRDEVPDIHVWVRIKANNGSYWDVDLVSRTISRAFFPIPLSMWDYMKLEEVINKQNQYEEGNR